MDNIKREYIWKEFIGIKNRIKAVKEVFETYENFDINLMKFISGYMEDLHFEEKSLYDEIFTLKKLKCKYEREYIDCFLYKNKFRLIEDKKDVCENLEKIYNNLKYKEFLLKDDFDKCYYTEKLFYNNTVRLLKL